MLSDTRHAVRDRDFRQTGTAGKSTPSDTRHAVRYDDFRQTGTAVKNTLSDTRHAVRDCDFRQTGTAGKSTIIRKSIVLPPFDICHAVRDRDFSQAGTAGKSAFSNTRHAVRDRDCRQTGTFVKSILSDTRHAVRDRDFRQTGTVVKSILSDTCHGFSIDFYRNIYFSNIFITSSDFNFSCIRHIIIQTFICDAIVRIWYVCTRRQHRSHRFQHTLQSSHANTPHAKHPGCHRRNCLFP